MFTYGAIVGSICKNGCPVTEIESLECSSRLSLMLLNNLVIQILCPLELFK